MKKNPMQVYVIAPLTNLSLMLEGDRIFVLAHLWLQSEEYRKFVLEAKKKGKFLTLDNSAAERALVSEDDLIAICKELMPNEVIAPDHLFDGHATLVSLQSFIQRMEVEGLLGKIQIFACPQGPNLDQWLACYKLMLSNSHVDVIGFSKIAVPRAFLGGVSPDQGIKEARHMAYNYLKVHGLLQKPIHCLGQGDPSEFAYYDHPMMRSTDSVYPVFAADQGVDFSDEKYEFVRIPTPHEYLHTAIFDPTKEKLAKNNIKILKSHCC